MPIASPPLCPILVDRDADLQALDALLQEAAAGHGRLVWLTGEAGVGKSRIARELASRASARGFQHVTGYCAERDREFPFAPIVDALRQQRAVAPAAMARLLEQAAQRGVLAELLPELRDDAEVAGDTVDLPPEQAKRRLFEAVTAWFAHLARERPLLVVLEDLHWADPTSLELLALLPRRLAESRLLVLATARPDEPNPELRDLLAALRRTRSMVELSIGPLSDEGVRRMVQALLPAPPSPSFVAAVQARTDGNPFFIEELVATAPSNVRWLIGETAVPETVQDTVLRRTGDLDAMARGVLDLAAIAGQRLSFELLLASCGLSPDNLLDVLRILVDRSLLVEEGPAGPANYAFRHALTRDALHGRLLEPRRRALHRVVAEALERSLAASQPDSGSARDLSYHFHAAGIWDKTLTYAMLAGAAADRLHATVEAITHHRRALDAALALDDPSAAALHHRCGLALSRLGAFGEALTHLEAALTIARQHGLVDVEQTALYDLAGLYASRDYPAAQRLAEEALAAARSMTDRQREGLALNRLGNVLTNLLRFDEGRALHEDALASFESEGDRWGSADSLDLIGMARYLAGEVPEAREAFGQAASVFADLGDSERVASALTSRGLYLAVLDGPCATAEPPDVFRDDAVAGLRICQEIAWRSGEAYALVALACAAIGSGHYGKAQQLAEEAQAIAEEMDHAQWTVIATLTLGILDAELCDLSGAMTRFQRALDRARGAGAAQWVERLDAWIAWCRVRAGETEIPLLSDLRHEAGRARPASIGQRRAIAALVANELAMNRPHDALAWTDLLLAGAAGARPAGSLLLRGDVLAVLGSTDEADAGYLDARRIAAAVGPRSVLWRVAAARSRLWHARDPALAATEAEIARGEIGALAETIQDEARRAAFLEAPDVRPWVTSRGRRRTADTASAGRLTAREREVAVRVAQGLTNKEIARALAIAEKTVEMHVSSCLGKLEFASRAQLAAWTVSEGLAPISDGR